MGRKKVGGRERRVELCHLSPALAEPRAGRGTGIKQQAPVSAPPRGQLRPEFVLSLPTAPPPP